MDKAHRELLKAMREIARAAAMADIPARALLAIKDMAEAALRDYGK